MCKKHMYQRLLWVNTSHFMFSLRTPAPSDHSHIANMDTKGNLCGKIENII